MKKIKLLFFAVISSFLFACVGQVNKSVNDAVAKSKLSLDNFKGIPKEIEGCSCYFSTSVEKFKEQQYLFAAGLDSIGFVAVNNKLIKLKLISSGRRPHSFGDNDHTDIYSTAEYKVTVVIKYKESNGEETWWNDGTVTIESRDGQKVTEKFVGECGC